MRLFREYSFGKADDYNPFRLPTEEDVVNAEYNGMVKGALYTLAAVTAIASTITIVRNFKSLKKKAKKLLN
jgi:hypothetical protein